MTDDDGYDILDAGETSGGTVEEGVVVTNDDGGKLDAMDAKLDAILAALGVSAGGES